MRLFACILLSMILSSCESGVVIDNIAPKDLLVVSSFISPQDSLLTAAVYKGQPLSGILKADSLIVKDAIVKLNDGLKETQLFYNIKSKLYESSSKNLKIEQGKKYFLFVRTANGKTLTGQCTIPEKPTEGKIEIIKDNDNLIIISEWQKVKDAKYYLPSLDVSGMYNSNGRNASLTLKLDFTKQSALINQVENTPIIVSGEVSNWFKATNRKLKITLSLIDENTYKYFVSYEKYRNWSSNIGGLIPNFTEPQPIFSNIEGDGIGIFGGFQQTSVSYF